MKIRGEFLLETKSNQDSYEVQEHEKNLIVNNASVVMAKILSNNTTNKQIDSFRLSTGGVDDLGDIITPDLNQSNLKSPSTAYTQSFTPLNGNPVPTINKDSNGSTVYNEIIITNTQNTIKYVIIIKEDNANTQENYSEAGLFLGNDLFATKTFTNKQKDINTEWKITWTLTW